MNLKQHAFVNEYLYWNDPVQAYKNAYNSKSSYKTLKSAANRLLKHPEVAAAIERSVTAIRSRVEQEVAKRLEVELLSIQEKRVILAQIARGEMYIEQTYKGKNCTQCKQYVKPSFNIMLRAIQEDSRLAGHYAKTIIKHNNSQQPKDETPLLSLGGDIGDVPMAQEPIGVVNSRTPLNHNNSQPAYRSGRQSGTASSTSQLKDQNGRVNSQQSNPAHTITHAGLRKLFSRTEQKSRHA